MSRRMAEKDIIQFMVVECALCCGHHKRKGHLPNRTYKLLAYSVVVYGSIEISLVRFGWRQRINLRFFIIL